MKMGGEEIHTSCLLLDVGRSLLRCYRAEDNIHVFQATTLRLGNQATQGPLNEIGRRGAQRDNVQ